MITSDHSTPGVSTIIATRGRAELLRRAIRSIIAQEYAGAQQIVVVYDQTDIDPLDDLRVDLPGTVSILTVANANEPGLAGGRNTGIALAAEELIAFCDDDDEWVPTKLRDQVALWRSHPEAVAVSSGIDIVTQQGVSTRIPPLLVGHDDLLRSRVGEIHPSSFLFRAADLKALDGGVDQAIPYSYGEDYDLLLRLTEQGPIVSAPEPLVIVHWDRASYFAGRWDAMAGGLSFLLDKHPRLLDDRSNAARMCGQVAFAYAAAGRRREAGSWVRRTLGHRVGEPRAWLAMLTLSKVVPPKTIIEALNRRGRGI